MQCLHCYSGSGPGVSEGNSCNHILRFLDFAAEQGYNNASFSGGEPFLFPELHIVLGHAKSLGLSTGVVTNGTIINTRLIQRVENLIDSLAISLDGPEHIHNVVRDSDTAYQTLLRNLTVFQNSNIKLALIHTLTSQTTAYVKWLADFCIENQFSLLHLHPLGIVGNARKQELEPLDGEALFRAYLAYGWLKSYTEEKLDVHIDIVNAEAAASDPIAWNILPKSTGEIFQISEAVNPLVLRADGKITPICYDMPEQFIIGSLKDELSLETLAHRYLTEQHQLFVNHCSELWQKTYSNLEWPYFNWYEVLENAKFGCS